MDTRDKWGMTPVEAADFRWMSAAKEEARLFEILRHAKIDHDSELVALIAPRWELARHASDLAWAEASEASELAERELGGDIR